MDEKQDQDEKQEPKEIDQPEKKPDKVQAKEMLENAEVILATVKEAYAEELDRFKQIESKTNIGLAFAGVLMSLFITWGSNLVLMNKNIATYTTRLIAAEILVLLSGFALFCFCRAIHCFVKSIKKEEYDRVNINNVLSKKVATDDVIAVKIKLAHTYKVVIQSNTETMLRKINFYDKGIDWTRLGFYVFVALFILKEVLKRV